MWLITGRLEHSLHIGPACGFFVTSNEHSALYIFAAYQVDHAPSDTSDPYNVGHATLCSAETTWVASVFGGPCFVGICAGLAQCRSILQRRGFGLAASSLHPEGPHLQEGPALPGQESHQLSRIFDDGIGNGQTDGYVFQACSSSAP